MKNRFSRFAAFALVLFGVTPAYAALGPLPQIVGQDHIYDSNSEDTLASIGEAHDVGFVALRAANPDVAPWAIDSGTDIILPGAVILPRQAPHTGIIINIGEMRLYDFTHSTTAPTIYAIGIGREGLVTPVGDYQIGVKI